jgi:hypothetical protein
VKSFVPTIERWLLVHVPIEEDRLVISR